jgi:hypothetical protein
MDCRVKPGTGADASKYEEVPVVISQYSYSAAFAEMRLTTAKEQRNKFLFNLERVELIDGGNPARARKCLVYLILRKL